MKENGISSLVTRLRRGLGGLASTRPEFAAGALIPRGRNDQSELQQ